VDNKGGQGLKIVCDSVDDKITETRPAASPHQVIDTPDRDATPPARAETCGCHLQISIPRTGDVERDRQRVREVYHLLTSYSGSDRFSLCIQDGNGYVRYDFPGHTTHNCVELQQRLTQMLGATAVRALPSLPLSTDVDRDTIR
jgi:hypothetical protein